MSCFSFCYRCSSCLGIVCQLLQHIWHLKICWKNCGVIVCFLLIRENNLWCIHHYSLFPSNIKLNCKPYCRNSLEVLDVSCNFKTAATGHKNHQHHSTISCIPAACSKSWFGCSSLTTCPCLEFLQKKYHLNAFKFLVVCHYKKQVQIWLFIKNMVFGQNSQVRSACLKLSHSSLTVNNNLLKSRETKGTGVSRVTCLKQWNRDDWEKQEWNKVNRG